MLKNEFKPATPFIPPAKLDIGVPYEGSGVPNTELAGCEGTPGVDHAAGVAKFEETYIKNRPTSLETIADFERHLRGLMHLYIPSWVRQVYQHHSARHWHSHFVVSTDFRFHLGEMQDKCEEDSRVLDEVRAQGVCCVQPQVHTWTSFLSLNTAWLVRCTAIRKQIRLASSRLSETLAHNLL